MLGCNRAVNPNTGTNNQAGTIRQKLFDEMSMLLGRQ
jgi:hypothetical protein